MPKPVGLPLPKTEVTPDPEVEKRTTSDAKGLPELAVGGNGREVPRTKNESER
jgi:hypothetical protein